MKTAYINGILLDGSKNMVPQTDKVILTDGDKIESIDAKGRKLDGYELVDLEGRYIMPGLINLHVHLPASGKPKKKQSDSAKLVKLLTSTEFLRKMSMNMCAGYAKTQLMSGVTTIRTVGGVLNFDTRIRDGILKGELEGPRIVASDMAVSVEGGHMAGSLAYVARSAEQARNYVRIVARSKPDLIKIMITGGVLDATVKGEPGELKMPPEFVKAACEEAHGLGLKVAAHVESTEGLEVALENGVDSIEHGAAPNDRIIELFRERGACLVTTLSPALPYALFDPAKSHATEIQQYNGRLVFEGIIHCAKACLAEDIPVGLGTDTGCPYVTQYDMWRELNYFHKYCGVSNAFALYTGTKRNAELIGLGGVTGSIEPGKCADFVVTEKNPLESLEALRNISMVVTRGKRIEEPRVKKMKNVERELDRFL
ncbi:amidohydrolase family protein [Hespellia stercorisuis]|uniref:Imidazolonepropionase n=1 Tax=Hespellia stercorisuis DSM 15480 TaxID=1121950 RepID=A0A1M6K8W1_9FIRM|nr:amidohydrolase family protein [Hespellia stercorisuis]SHJ55300.1 Imidazolonepropionase [Hespellia stercorisuis DSM 15480]